MTRKFIIHAADIVRLLTHYTDGVVPMDAEVRQFGNHRSFPQQLAMLLTSSQWHDAPEVPTGPDRGVSPGLKPLHIRYTGDKVLVLNENDETVRQFEKPPAPKIQ